MQSTSNPNVGPGTYIDINNPINSSVTKNLLKYAVDKGIMMAHGLESKPFGIGERRFDKNYFMPKEGPGPADYKQPILECTLQPTKNKIGFSATTERFVYEKNEEENTVKTNNEVTIDKVCVKQTRTPYYQTFNGKNIPFDSTRPRFFYEKKEIPGPGYYLTRASIGQKQNKSFNVTEEKFKPQINSYFHITSTNNKVGPGTYTHQNNVVKKSFNINSYTFE